MRRREFIAGLGAAAWPVVARARQAERMHRIGLLMGLVESDPEAQSRITMLRQSLRELGWTEGRNLLIDYRWGASDPDRYGTYAAQLVALAPDAETLLPVVRGETCSRVDRVAVVKTRLWGLPPWRPPPLEKLV
jgi:hypothetical protein